MQAVPAGHSASSWFHREAQKAFCSQGCFSQAGWHFANWLAVWTQDCLELRASAPLGAAFPEAGRTGPDSNGLQVLAGSWVLEPRSADFHPEPLQLWAFIFPALTLVSLTYLCLLAASWGLQPPPGRAWGAQSLLGTGLLEVSLQSLPCLPIEGIFQRQQRDLL